jgi:AraC-like DNA-binding protein
MTVFDRTAPAAPLWTETLVSSGRGNVGTGMFDRVFFVDVFGGFQGLTRVRNLVPAAATSGLSHVISTGHEVALEEDRSPMLLLPQSGRIFCAMGGCDLKARPGQALFLPRGRRRTVTLPEGAAPFRAVVLRVAEPEPDSPLAVGAALTLADLPDLATASTLVADLVQSGAVALDTVTARLQAAETLLAGALSGLQQLQDGPPRMPVGSNSALQRAEALLREHAAEHITIRDIADRAGLSMRQMQHLFATHHGLSPHAWLTRLRLEAAHLRLKGALPAPSVTDTALSAGLTHLGRFPAQYRARFGTLPSVGRTALP